MRVHNVQSRSGQRFIGIYAWGDATRSCLRLKIQPLTNDRPWELPLTCQKGHHQIRDLEISKFFPRSWKGGAHDTHLNMAIARPIRVLGLVAIGLWIFFLYQVFGKNSKSRDTMPNTERDPLLDRMC